MAKSKKSSTLSSSTPKASTPKMKLGKTLSTPKELDLSTTPTAVLEIAMIGLTCLAIERCVMQQRAKKQTLVFGGTAYTIAGQLTPTPHVIITTKRGGE